MVVGIMRIELHLPMSHSLKDKRSLLKSLKDRIGGRFNVAVAEVDPNDSWQRACFGVASVGSDRRYVDGLLNEVVELVRRERFIALISVERERY